MAEALSLFYSIYDAFVTWVFGLEIVSGVSLGWVLIVVMVLFFILNRFKFLGKSGTGGEDV